MAKFCDRKKNAIPASAASMPSPRMSTLQQQIRGEGTRAALGGTSTHTSVGDYSLWNKMDMTNTPFKYAYKYGIALSNEFLQTSMAPKGFKQYHDKMMGCGAYIFKIEHPKLNYMYSFGTSGFIAHGTDPVQIKWFCSPSKQEKYRMSHFLHYLDPRIGDSDCMLLRASWYFIDAERSRATIIHAPSVEEMKHLDARIKKELNHDYKCAIVTSEFFNELERKEQNSVKRKRKSDVSSDAMTPKRRKLLELRKTMAASRAKKTEPLVPVTDLFGSDASDSDEDDDSAGKEHLDIETEDDDKEEPADAFSDEINEDDDAIY